MSVAVSYPGVYVQEIPSGVRTITPVATAIAAFLGRTATGPINQPVTLNSFGDFGRVFGGLGANFPVSYAVRDFFANGGGQAIVVRLYNYREGPPPGSTNPDGATRLTFPVNGSPPSGAGPLILQAASPGSWGTGLAVQLIPQTDGNAIIAAGLAPPGIPTTPTGSPPALDPRLFVVFDLAVYLPDPVTGTPTQVERIRNLTLSVPAFGTSDSPRRIDKVLGSIGAGSAVSSESAYLRVSATTAALLQSQSLTELPQFLVPPSTATNPPNAIFAPTALNSGAPADIGNDGNPLGANDYIPTNPNTRSGIFGLEDADLFNLLCIPPDTRGGDLPARVIPAAASYCVKRRALFIVDPPTAWNPPATGNNVANIVAGPPGGLAALGNFSGLDARNAAVFFPRLIQADPLNKGRLDTFPPCGAIAGIMASTDLTRGVFKAPAGVDASIGGVQGLAVAMTDAENGQINPLGVNALRTFPIIGTVVWGSRTLRGADALADDYKYIPVRRLALFIEESLFRGTKFAVFEPNAEPLWSQIRLNVGAFMQNLFRQGAFAGASPRDAYFVKCDGDTTTQNDINLGQVNVIVGFAPLKPAEFVIISIQQIAGQIAT
ncbi:phage tail sheath family protein [Pendulispora albinea]|uniref:Tail sheath protein C-terminal domain-containing protein n=1 Tax=Pendulispora albinea TaxID=2741071 RepID=A0ABZ2MAR8_9BACT